MGHKGVTWLNFLYGTGEDENMRVTVNGETREAPDRATVAVFLALIGVDPVKVAVERNREIVPRSAYDSTRLKDADQLEIVQFVGGG